MPFKPIMGIFEESILPGVAIIVAILFCLDTLEVSIAMTKIVSLGGWGSSIGALSGMRYLIPRLTWILLIAIMIKPARPALAIFAAIVGIIGLQKGVWYFEMTGRFEYDPDRDFSTPSSYALYVSACANVSLLILSFLSAFAWRFLNNTREKLLMAFQRNRSILLMAVVVSSFLVSLVITGFFLVFFAWSFLLRLCLALLILASGAIFIRQKTGNQRLTLTFISLSVITLLTYLGLLFNYFNLPTGYYWEDLFGSGHCIISVITLAALAALILPGTVRILSQTPA